MDSDKTKNAGQKDASVSGSDVQQDVSRFRILGAVVWFGLLIWIVPGWFAHPVHFSPNGLDEDKTTVQAPAVGSKQPYLVPVSDRTAATRAETKAPVKPAVKTEPVEKAETPKASANVPAQAPVSKQTPAEVEVAETASKPAVAAQAAPEQPATQKAPPSTRVSVATKEPKASDKDQWIVRIVAYKQEEYALAMLERLGNQYPAFIKQIPVNKFYSVQIGPYQDRAFAVADQKELEQILHVRAELVKIPALKSK